MIAALLQYFFIAMFCWAVCEGLQFFMTLTTGKNKKSSRLKYFFIIGWSKLKRQISIGGSLVCEYSRRSSLPVAGTFRDLLHSILKTQSFLQGKSAFDPFFVDLFRSLPKTNDWVSCGFL